MKLHGRVPGSSILSVFNFKLLTIHITAFLTELCDMEHLNSTNLQASHNKLKVVCCIAYEICSRIQNVQFWLLQLKFAKDEDNGKSVEVKFSPDSNMFLKVASIPRYSCLQNMVPYTY